MNRLLFLVAGISLLVPSLASAGLTSFDDGHIEDDYIGAGDSEGGHRDVVGGADFNTHSLDASLSGQVLTVTINTAFAGHGGIFPSLTYGNTGVGYGDLFLSAGWTPLGTTPYLLDDFYTGNRWDYALAMADADRTTPGNNSGSATLDRLGSGYGRSDLRLSDDFISTGTPAYRENQEVAVDLAGPNISAVATSVAEWSVDEINDTLAFSVDLSTTGLLAAGNNSLGLRWQMYCANDIIEGQVGLTHLTTPAGNTPSAPTPGSVALLLPALVGLRLAARRRRQS